MGSEDKKYTIVDKCFDGIRLVGMTIETDEHKTQYVDKHDIMKLARNGKIKDTECILDTDTGEYVIDYKNGLDTLDTTYKSNTMLTPLCRMISRGKCVGYKVRDNSGKSYKLSINKIWELAFNHSIVGVRAVIIGGNKVLLSDGDMELKNLPKTIA